MKKTIIIGITTVLLILLILNYFKHSKKNIDVDKVEEIYTIENVRNIEEVDYSELEEFNVKLTDSLQIKKGGVYHLEGIIDNGQIYIDTKENVKLILNGVNITNKNGPAIMVENANQVYIELASNSVNYLTDGEDYSVSGDNEFDGTIFSKDDLILDGLGKLIIDANYADGIVAKDNLKIVNGNFEINAVDDAIRGKDSLVIMNGNFTINSLGDGLKATNDGNSKLGYILIENGEFNIVVTNDGIQAETDLVINNGDFNIKTGGGSANSSLENTNWGKWNDSFSKNNSIKNKEMDSAKGLKSINNIVINNGNFTIDSSDDAIHSNAYVGISNGNFTINSGDDGIHADKEIIIDDGTININKSYEGIEANSIIINDGIINITSSDDGINAAGGNDASSMNNRPGMNNFEGNGNSKIQINGGNIYANASGDGIDANGSIYMTGGMVIINGPIDNSNGAIDYDKEFQITGGTFIASGSSGMAQNVSNNSTQTTVMINFSKSINADELISIFDSDGKEIITYKANKRYQNLVVSTPNFKLNETYTIYTSGTSESQEINGLYNNDGYKDGNKYTTFITNNVINNVGNSGGFNQGMNMGPNGPGKRP